MIRQGQVTLKSLDSKAVPQAMQANLQVVLREYQVILVSDNPSVVLHLHNLNKSIMVHVTKISKNFCLTLVAMLFFAVDLNELR